MDAGKCGFSTSQVKSRTASPRHPGSRLRGNDKRRNGIGAFYKAKKPSRFETRKLFIGLTTKPSFSSRLEDETTKPRYELQSRSKTTQLILDTLLEASNNFFFERMLFWAKKHFVSKVLFPILAVWTGLIIQLLLGTYSMTYTAF